VAGDLADDVDIVLHCNRHAQQRAWLICPQARERRIGLGQRRVGTHRYESVEPRI
jgi:hypothetical protein